MINSVRSTVLSIANKNNFGYISPADFNLYAKQAQLDLFEDYFYKYSIWQAKQNARMSGSGYADVLKSLEEVIDIFSLNANLTYGAGVYALPSDYYLMNVIKYGNKEVEKVSNSKILNLVNSNLTAPTVNKPAYVMNGDAITVYPSTIVSGVSSQYIRRPLDPNWTYSVIIQGEPLFDQSNSDYQDFELPKSDEPSIVAKILQYIGISIREAELYTFANGEETKEQQKEG